MPIHYSLGLLCAYYALLVMEFFVPSGGIIGVVAAASAIASVVIAFTHSFNFGVIVLAIVTFTTPFVFMTLVRVWPKTRMGQRMLNRRPGEIASASLPRSTPKGTALVDLVDQDGVAMTDLVPSGRIQIQQERLDAISVSGPIDAGTPIVVTDVSAGRIRVRVKDEVRAKNDEALGENEGGASSGSGPSVDKAIDQSFDLDNLSG